MQSKSILITGCSSGIGLHAAQALQQRGYQVIASCRKSEDISALHDKGLKHVIQLDLSDSNSIDNAVEQTLSLTGGRLFALFNNGAYGLPGALEDVSRAALTRQFEVNVFGTHELTTKLIPHFLTMPDARIVQNSSVLGFIAAPNRGAYNASKYALEGLTDTLRLELRGTSIKCVLIEPGPIESKFRDNALKMFKQEIDRNRSRHKTMYEDALVRLERQGPGSSYTLPPDAVTCCLVSALERPNPKIRYRITRPTQVMAVLKRILPGKALDAFLHRFAAP